MSSFPKPLGWTVIGMLALALLPLPYGYYTLLRLVVCVAFVWSALDLFQRELIGWAVAAGVVALLYNPVIPVYLDRELWMVVNIVTAGVMGGVLVALGRAGARATGE